jgi:predicted AAA+ superfamily ATPase
LAKNILKDFNNAIYLDLEKYSDLAKLDDAEKFLELNKNIDLICIDEIQLKPNLFKTLRSFVDENPNSRFLILGSASPELLRQSSETLAGRIFYYTLNPFGFLEIESNKTLEEYHLLGGFPKSILSKNKFAFEWLDNFIRTFLERDLDMFGFSYPPRTIHRLWVMLAHLNSQTLNYAMLSKSMGIDVKNIKKYIDALQNTFMIRLLEPYHINIKKRLVKSPKIYIKDSGILHSLLHIDSYNSLYENPSFGASWESLTIENIINQFKKWDCFYYRTADGAEIDLVLISGLEIIAIEIKSSLSPKVGKGFWLAREDIKATKSFIIAPVKESYPYKNDVMVYPLDEFLKLDL